MSPYDLDSRRKRLKDAITAWHESAPGCIDPSLCCLTGFPEAFLDAVLSVMTDEKRGLVK